jgi:glycosyltransferase involved in cell wall biosynthesis
VHLTALVESPDHVCCRYRVAAFRTHLERAGHRLEIRSWPRHCWAWFALSNQLRHADAVLLQRKLLQRWQLYLLRRASRRLLFDFDDAVFLRDSYARHGLHSATRRRRFAAVTRAADVVIAGNTFLAEQARRWVSGERIRIIPTCVEPARYPLAEHVGESCSASGAVQLVWVGSASTLQGLETIRPLLEDLGRGLPELRLKLICDRFLKLEHLLVVPCAWSETGEAAEISAADIGISWIPDDAWSRGKCGLKVLQYMAAGLPVVANPVGLHTELIRHGENGFLARTPAEWAEALIELVHNPALRRCMGEEGRRRVEEEYSVAVGGAAWAALLDGLASQRKAA